MQNKGFVIFIVAFLSLICLYYISFTPVVNHYDKKADEIAAMRTGDKARYDGDLAAYNRAYQKNKQAYLDSMANEKVWFGYTLKKARQQQIGLGLDLKGGMNVVLHLDGTELLRNLANHSEAPAFLKALETTRNTAGDGFIDQFVREYKKINPQGQLAALFGNGSLRDQISARTTDDKVVDILKERYEAAIGASLNVLRTRIDRFGVVSPNLQRIEGQDRILVELPGIKEPERVRELLQRSANLQFWRTYRYEEIIEDLNNANTRLMQGAASATQEKTVTADSTETQTETLQADSAQQKELVANAEQEKTAGQNAAKSLFALLQPVNRGTIVGMARAADREEIDAMLHIAKEKKYLREDLMLLWGNAPVKDPTTKKETDLYELYAIRGSRFGQPDLSGDVVTSAKSEVRNDIGQNKPVVSMTMDEEGSRQWARLTKDNIGRSIAIVLDGVVYSAPNVPEKITGGRSEISGSFTIEETTDLANVLGSGKMETSITIEQENVVGPTLGQESIRAGIISFIIAILLLAIYMCIIYGLVPGLIADGALIVNSFFTIGIMASFHSVLTLSGIAGLVLTLGMAVDANVLIFERIKEELRAGKTVTRAIKDGYGNAFSAIFDSNLTTVITGAVLFFFGTGPIKGFATTLVIGVIASFITAVFLTRLVVEALDRKGKMSKITYTTSISRNLLVNPQYNILGSRKKGLVFFGALIIAGLIAIFTVGLNKGIEFSGGRNFVVAFDTPVSTEAVRSSLTGPLEGKVLVTSIGTEGKEVRISTNYKIDQNTEAAENEVNAKLYEGLKGFYQGEVTPDQFSSEKIVSSQRVSPSMSKDIRDKAIVAVLISLVFVALYILLRFRNVAFSLGAFGAVSATTLSILSLYALLWKVMPFALEIDQNFIAALLAIIGYSINDVVVVFDRVRETTNLYPNRDRFSVMNDALNSTLARTLNTSLTTFLVMLVVFILGGASMRSFTFSILLGVAIGTFCTLFVAAPIAYTTLVSSDKKRKNKIAAAGRK